ncbi:hypothetical protein LXL04_039811 [Taraxacum kok-saghyz]
MNAVGTIPEGLWTLTYLTNLYVLCYFFTKLLDWSLVTFHWQFNSDAISKSSDIYNGGFGLFYRTFGINALSGKVPPELGLLTDLRSLSFATNSFNGSLPSELGNLRKLEQIYIGSTGVGGEIPNTFANLVNMQTTRASDNNFTGRIPDFIGNWSQLRSLRISGLSNGNLGFIRDLKSLSILSLRNSGISGSVPNDIGEYNFTQLFLGNNSLTGTLPNVKSTTLVNIDLSYNELSGTLPSWANDRGLQLYGNIVVNNFTSNDSTLNCFQRGFTCVTLESTAVAHKLQPQVDLSTSKTQLLGPATYYLKTPERRWGVSNVGRRDNPIYIVSSQRQYYGLGLENGNYTVDLRFAELVTEDGPTWRSLGRRVFDIYIQIYHSTRAMRWQISQSDPSDGENLIKLVVGFKSGFNGTRVIAVKWS